MDHKGVIDANAGEMTTRAAHPLVVLSLGFYCSFLKISVILIDCVLAHLITLGNTADCQKTVTTAISFDPVGEAAFETRNAEIGITTIYTYIYNMERLQGS